MKSNTLRLLLGLVTASPLVASFESVGVEVTVEPAMPAALRMVGLRDGKVTLMLDVGPDGRLADVLVTRASHHELISPCLEAVRRWRFKPARYEREPVSARLEITLNISQTGAVVSRNAAEMLEEWTERLVGRPMDYAVCPAAEVDRPLVPRDQVSPQYARDAESIGVRGRVRVHFFVDEQGRVRMPAVAPETHPYLSSIATEALLSWKFEPPTRQGRPVVVAAVQEFDFGRVP